MTVAAPAEAPSSEKLAFLGSLASGLVHELRNPLNAIRANLQLMEEDVVREEEGDGPHTRRVRRLLGEVGRLDKILSDFLAFVRGSELIFARVDLSALLQEVVTFLTPQADGQGVTVLPYLEENVVAEADGEAIRQAILNLAINGLQAMEGEGRAGTLMLRLAQGDLKGRSAAVIDVIDTGRGIPEDRLHRIFEHFYTTREGGTGIGLSVVSRIVTAHDGDIKCESESGRGTHFRIRIPLARVASEEATTRG